MLLPDWKKVAKKAWSMRLMYVTAALTGAEAILPFLDDALAPRPLSLVTLAVVTLAMFARLYAQKEFRDD